MANLIGSSLFTSAISGLNTNYLLLSNGGQGLTIDNILNPQDNTIKYTVTAYHKEGVGGNVNSDVISGTIEQDGRIGEFKKNKTSLTFKI